MEGKKEQRNVLELKVTKIHSEIDPASLTHEDLGKLLFYVQLVLIKYCLAFDFNTRRYNTKQVKMKPGATH